jgi:hypothetical protein
MASTCGVHRIHRVSRNEGRASRSPLHLLLLGCWELPYPWMTD